MVNNIKCPANLYVPTGMTGSLSVTNPDLTTVFPAIKHKVYVSFNVDDCKAMNMDVLHEDILDQAISHIDQNKSFLSKSIDIFFGKNLSFEEKKSKVLNEGDDYILNGYLKPLNTQDIQYFKDLFSNLNCLSNLEFELIDEL